MIMQDHLLLFKVIQIDEPAIREGLPLRKADWQSYLEWAVKAFRITASGVQDETQIHTHMCYGCKTWFH